MTIIATTTASTMHRLPSIALALSLAVSLAGCPDDGSTKGPNPDKKTCFQSCQEGYDNCLRSGRDIETCTREYNACEKTCE